MLRQRAIVLHQRAIVLRQRAIVLRQRVNIIDHRQVLVCRFIILSNQQKLQNTISGEQLFERFIFLDHGKILKIEKVVAF